MTFGELTTDLGEIFDVLKTRLVAQTAIAADYVYLSVDDDDDPLERPPCDRFLVVRLDGFKPEAGVIRGAGNNLVNFRGQVGVEAFARLHTDQAGRGYNLLTAASVGVLPLWLKVLAALHQYDAPRPATPTKSLLTEYITSGSWQFPRRKRPAGWGRVFSSWNIAFLHRLS